MIKKSVLLFILAAIVSCTAAVAQTAKVPSTAPVMGPVQDYSTELSLYPLPPPNSVTIPNAEAPLFRYVIDERVRSENWNDVSDYNYGVNDEHEQMRYLTRIAGSLSTPHSELQLNTRLINEINKALYPNARFNNNEVVVDNLYLTVNKTYIPGLTVNVGRQQWLKNDGFLFLDGSAGDGSRTMYFNMLNIAYAHKQSKLEFVGILDPRLDRMLPVIHNQHKNLNEWDEQALGVYYTDRNHRNTDIDAFYFLKKEINDYRAPTNALFQPDKRVNTIGGRILQRFPKGMSLKGEAALQFDSLHANPAKNLDATSYTGFGGYVTFIKQFRNDKGKPYVMGSYTVLSSSDKQANGAGFDPLFSRWPRYSELYVYSQVNEKGVAYATNDRIIEGLVGFSPTKHFTMRALLAQHQALKSIGTFNPTLFGKGTNRGENFQVRGDLILSRNWMGHMLWERWWAGDFYAHQNPAFFFRTEVTYSFRGSVNGWNK